MQTSDDDDELIEDSIDVRRVPFWPRFFGEVTVVTERSSSGKRFRTYAARVLFLRWKLWTVEDQPGTPGASSLHRHTSAYDYARSEVLAGREPKFVHEEKIYTVPLPFGELRIRRQTIFNGRVY